MRVRKFAISLWHGRQLIYHDVGHAAITPTAAAKFVGPVVTTTGIK